MSTGSATVAARGQHIAIVFPRAAPTLQDRLGQFLDEQRHAVGPVDDLVEDLARQRPAAGDAARPSCAPSRRPRRLSSVS